MKKLLTLFFIGSLCFCFVSNVSAANTRKGKKTYDRLCRSCHIRGAHGGRVAPSNKTMAEWKKFIGQNQHAADLGIINDMQPSERENLIKFLQDFAKDAKGAESCG